MRGHAKPGDALQLYTGMRTSSCQLVSRETCLGTIGIVLNFRHARVLFAPSLVLLDRPAELDGFARFDGFESWDDMAAFWLAINETDRAKGTHIRWLPWPPGLLDEALLSGVAPLHGA